MRSCIEGRINSLVRAVAFASWITGLLLFLMINSAAATTQDEIQLSLQVKTAFIYRFTNWVTWPAPKQGNPKENNFFLITIVGESPLSPYLSQLASNRRIQKRPVQINSVHSSALPSQRPDILVIGNVHPKNLDKILDFTRVLPILVIADHQGFAKEGVMINFYIENGKVRFEINKSAVERSGIQISSQLLKLARIIE